MDKEYRYFYPARTDTLREFCKPWINKRVTVISWHPNISMKDTHLNDEVVGFVEEFYADIPISELSLVERSVSNIE